MSDSTHTHQGLSLSLSLLQLQGAPVSTPPSPPLPPLLLLSPLHLSSSSPFPLHPSSVCLDHFLPSFYLATLPSPPVRCFFSLVLTPFSSPSSPERLLSTPSTHSTADEASASPTVCQAFLSVSLSLSFSLPHHSFSPSLPPSFPSSLSLAPYNSIATHPSQPRRVLPLSLPLALG